MTSSGITAPFETLFRNPRYVTYLFLTLSPLTYLSVTQLICPFDLHVLAMPPAFILSQDQTLQFVLKYLPFGRILTLWNQLKISLTQRDNH